MSDVCAALAFAAKHLANRQAWARGRAGAIDEHGRHIHALSPRAVGRSLRGALELAAAQPFRGRLKVRPSTPDLIEFDEQATADAFFAILLGAESAFGLLFDFEGFNESTTHAGVVKRLADAMARCGCECASEGAEP